ncbi:hypothetical protein CRENBAI_000512 [Crenichthys baileyi]|uniref:Uncharacterized protein n=1 Tax=Crenichthys baileyi TaxID=28760 RepID=A0AAV9S5T3_9TELE
MLPGNGGVKPAQSLQSLSQLPVHRSGGPAKQRDEQTTLLVYRSKLCSREFPAETLTLRRQVEQFPRSEGRTTGPHHRGYSSNVQFGRPTGQTAPPATEVSWK